jgi:excisionase family DNA binding protein
MHETVGWLSKQDAAHRVGVSTKTIEQLATKKKIHRKLQPRPGKPPMVMYREDDVEELQRERQAHVVKFAPLPNPNETQLIPVEMLQAAADAQSGARSMQELGKFILEGLLDNRKPNVRIPERIFLTRAEAAEYTGLPPIYIERAVKMGKLDVMKTGRGWRIRRTDLEKL